MNFEEKDYYNKLGVTKNASIDQIRTAYYLKKFDNSDVPIWQKEDLDEAYDVLSNPKTRNEYDKSLEQQNSNIGYNNPQSFVQDEVIENNTDDNTNQIDKSNSDNSFTIDNSDIMSQPNDSYNIEIPSVPSEEEDNIKTDTSANPNLSEQSFGDLILDELKFKQDVSTQLSDFDTVVKREKRNDNYKVIISSTLAFSVMGPVGAVAMGLIADTYAKKSLKNISLNRNFYNIKIHDIQTQESKLIDEYNEKLKMQIDKLLQTNYNDFNLQKYKVSYSNQIELLEQIINIRENTAKKSGQLISHHLKIFALKTQLIKLKNNLKNIEKNIKRNELLSAIGKENINLDSYFLKNLTLGNIYLNSVYKMNKIKLQGGLVIPSKNYILNAKDFILKKVKSKLENQVDSGKYKR